MAGDRTQGKGLLPRAGKGSCPVGATLALLLASVLFVGCREPRSEEGTTGTVARPAVTVPPAGVPPSTTVGPAETPQGVELTTAPGPAPEPQPPPRPTVPEVVLSQSLRASCVVWVGDTLPGARLWDLAGQPQAVRDHLGSRLTVVLLWSAGQSRLARLAAQKLLTDLQEEVLRPFGSDGVALLAIHVGEADSNVKRLVEEAGISYPVLVDPNRAYFALLAKEYLPRVYLVDSRGKILWLELNFTELAGKVRDDLIQAIQAALSVAG